MSQTTATAAPGSPSMDVDQSGSKVQRIIVLDNIAAEGIAMLENEPGIEFEVHTGLAGLELREKLQGFQGAVCRSGVKITAEALEGNTSLRAIARAGVGTDNIDKETAAKLGIVVMNTPTGNTVSTAEHTMALMLGLSRNVAPAHASLQAGNWDRKAFSGRQLQGKTLGVVGLGRIGQEVAKRAKAFGMTVVGYDPFLSATQIESLGIEPTAEVDSMLPRLDYLTVHTPLNDQTRGLIGKPQLDLLKPGARLVNCARGGIYEEAALIEGLETGKIGGVALDVYESEPCTDSPLFQMPNVLCTPHLGASTAEAQVQVATEAVELLIGYLKHGEIKHAVNTAALDPKTLAEIRGYVDVAYRLGVMLGGWHAGGIEKVVLEYGGELAQTDRRILTSSFCAGLLSKAIKSVNVINAQLLARERGIEIVTGTNESKNSFTSSIAATVSGDGRECRAAGTVLGKDMPRLVEIGDYRTDAYLDGIIMLFTLHRDMPGVIGYVGGVLSKEMVNIAQMVVARIDQGENPAIGVLNLDSMASEQAMAQVADYEGIESVHQIELPRAGESPEWLA